MDHIWLLMRDNSHIKCKPGEQMQSLFHSQFHVHFENNFVIPNKAVIYNTKSITRFKIFISTFL